MTDRQIRNHERDQIRKYEHNNGLCSGYPHCPYCHKAPSGKIDLIIIDDAPGEMKEGMWGPTGNNMGGTPDTIADKLADVIYKIIQMHADRREYLLRIREVGMANYHRERGRKVEAIASSALTAYKENK